MSSATGQAPPPGARGRVYATCDIGGRALDRLRQEGYQLEVCQDPGGPPHELIVEKTASGIAALITTLHDPIDAQVFEAGRGTLRVVAQDAVGVDNVDLEAASRCGIPVVHTPDVLTDATAEFALFMLGDVSRKLYPSERLVRELRWGPWHPSQPFLGDEVSAKTAGIIGLGRIGQAFALKCSGLEMDFVAHTRRPDEEFASAMNRLFDVRCRLGLSRRRNSFRYSSLEACLEASDYVSLHVPLTAETRGLINAAALTRMKPTAYLINTSRGAVIDQDALYRALAEEWIAGAALDVYEEEPLPQDSPLRSPELEDRLRLYHHFGSGTKETRLSPDPNRGMAGRCVQGAIDVLNCSDRNELSNIPFIANKSAFS